MISTADRPRPVTVRSLDPRTIAIAVLMLFVAVGGSILHHVRSRVDVRRELVDADITLRAGNYSAARNHAMAAVRAEPRSAIAHALLGRAYLQLGEGLAAEAALTRAREAGLPDGRLHHLLAHASLLQGDAAGAIAEAARAPARYHSYALRVIARAEALRGNTARATAALTTLTITRPGDADGWRDLGRVLLSAGDIGGAAQAAARAAALAPGDPAALTLQGEVVRARYGLVASLPWFSAALARDAYYHPALIEYAATLGEAGRYARMLAMTRRAQQARPGSPQAFYLQSILAARAGRYDLARELLGKTAGVVDDLPGAIMLSGSLDYAQGKYEQAIAMWRRVVTAQPLNITARRLLGAALLRSGDVEGALAMLKPIAVRADADRYTLSIVAQAFAAIGDREASARYRDLAAAASDRQTATVFATDTSLATLAAAAAAKPDDPDSLLSLIRVQLGAGDGANAIARARALAAASPGAPAAAIAQGDTLALAGRDGEAAIAYAHAADLSFDEPTMLRLIDSLGRAGRAREAAAALAFYLSQNPQSPTARRLLGHWQLAAGMPDAAIMTLERVRRMTGNRDAALLADLARSYAVAGRGDVARRYGRAAYALAPLDASVADAYGIALAADGDADGARQLLAKAAALAPADIAIAAHRNQIAG